MEIEVRWRGELTDAELVELVRSHGGRPEPGWWDRVRPHSLGWVTARTADGLLVGFVNVATDGGEPAASGCTSTSTSSCARSTSTRAASRSRTAPA